LKEEKERREALKRNESQESVHSVDGMDVKMGVDEAQEMFKRFSVLQLSPEQLQSLSGAKVGGKIEEAGIEEEEEGMDY
jgi:hypothetical protein